MSITSTTHTKVYFPEIDGLRALAVLFVMVYHLNEHALPGGFIGVDIFFVISGYVVTRSMMRDSDRRFFSFLTSFYSRRFVRILPALLLTLVFTIALSILLIPHAWLSEALKETALYAFAGLSNFALNDSSDGYFAPRSEFNPFTHTWSLAVEEQFCLLYPVLLYWTVFRGAKVLKHGVIVVSLASLIWSMWISKNDSSSAYYMLPSRFWELGLGAIICLMSDTHKTKLIHLIGRRKLANLGLSFIAIAAIAAQKTAFPFPWAIPAVIGTACLILVSISEGEEGVVEKILSASPLVYIGLMSYSLYLWHWPVYTLMRWTVGLNALSLYVVAWLLSFILAWLSWQFVEKPIRRVPSRTQISAPKIVISGLATVILCWFGAVQAYKYESSLKLSIVEKNHDDWYPYGAGALAFTQTPCNVKRVHKSSNEEDFIPESCDLGVKRSNNRLFVSGDSHAAAYDRLLDNTTRLTGIEIYRFSLAGCATVNLVHPKNQYSDSCRVFQKQFLTTLLNDGKPGDVLFLPALRVDRLVEQTSQINNGLSQYAYLGKWQNIRLAEQEAFETIEKISQKGIKVIIELPKPVFPSPPYRCADSYTKNNPICVGGNTISREFMESYRLPIVKVARRLKAKLSNVYLWDPLQGLCSIDYCQSFRNGKPLYFDGDHISGYGNEVLLPSFVAVMKEIFNLPVSSNNLLQYILTHEHATVNTYYKGSLSVGIDFSRKGFPDFVSAVTGLSGRESWGRWSDENMGRLSFTFTKQLPRKFDLEITARSFGPNEGQPIKVYYAGQVQTFKVGYEPEKVTLSFNSKNPSNLIVITPPFPTSPTELDQKSEDGRLLGVGLIDMKIHEEK